MARRWITFFMLFNWFLPALAPAADLQQALETEACENVGTVTHKAETLDVVRCGDFLVFSDYTMLVIPKGAIAVIFENSLYFYSPSLNQQWPADMDERSFAGLE